ncbi:hypothetical protein ACFQYP_60075 [Nonomuraea antimicrobica]
MAEPATDVIARSAVTRVPCDSPHAWARVLAFAAEPASCPSGSGRYLRADGSYRPVTCLSLLSK